MKCFVFWDIVSHRTTGKNSVSFYTMNYQTTLDDLQIPSTDLRSESKTTMEFSRMERFYDSAEGDLGKFTASHN